MKFKYRKLVLAVLVYQFFGCTKLDTVNYSTVANDNFWQTPAQIQAGIAPAYAALQPIPDGGGANFGVQVISETTSDEMIIPTRGGQWADAGQYQALWQHTFTADNPYINGAWGQLYNGIGKINFILSVVNNLPEKPATLDNINAELKVLRAYFYFMTMDLFGNVPLVADYSTSPDSVTNSSRTEVYNFIEKELKENIQLLSPDVNKTTYGRVTRWFGHGLLAKLYLNAQVYIGSPKWSEAASECDSVILSGRYTLEGNYFDNFSSTNENSKENIFVVPFQNGYIAGNEVSWQNLHQNNDKTFSMLQQPWNGFCSTADFYSNYDTSSSYSSSGGNILRSFNDARSGQYLVGQQFGVQYNYPPDKNVIVASNDPSLYIKDATTGVNLAYNPHIAEYSSPSTEQLMSGVRNIKYFPDANIPYDQSNDMVIMRLADIILMKAEALMRNSSGNGEALDLVNLVRQRAYHGDPSHNITASELTFDFILAERAREFSWENWRRNDLIRFEKASGTRYFSGARNPEKSTDVDNRFFIFPIPTAQMVANPNLVQNPGYQ